MNNLNTLSANYPFDPATRTFTIPLRLKQYDDFFNPMDPSPAPIRDLSYELVDYLNQCSDEIENRYPVVISLAIQTDKQNPQSESECVGSLRTYYQHLVLVSQSQVRRKRRQAFQYLLVSCLCLAVYVGIEQMGQASFLWNLLKEAILIGGWVFMWEAVTLNFIEMDTPIQEIKKFRRLIGAKIIFSYEQAGGWATAPGTLQN